MPGTFCIHTPSATRSNSAPSLPAPDFKSWAICCLQAARDAQAADRLRDLFHDPAFDLPGFLQYIRHQRISPLIHDTVGESGILPPEASAQFQKDYLQTVWINTRRIAEIQQMLIRLDAAEIPVTLLKGSALLFTLYLKYGLRPMRDIDLLVPGKDINQAAQVFLSCGYQYAAPSIMPTDFQTETPFIKVGGEGWRIDLHSSLFNPPNDLSSDQLDWFWENREQVARGNIQAWTFNPTAQLLHLCAHLWLHHGGGDLLWEYDIDRLIQRSSERIDWNTLISIAGQFDLIMPLQKVLPYMLEAWKSPVPVEVCAQVARMTPSTREKRKFDKHWGDDRNYLSTFLGGVMSYPDWPSRLRYASLIMFPPRQYIVERYQVHSPLLVPYFYAYRLAARAIQQLGRIL